MWRQELSRFLLQCRTTPHCTTKVAPSELIFSRKIRGKLPSLEKKLVVNRHKEARENETKSQAYHKSYADNLRNAKESSIKVGDTVFVKQKRQNKFTSRFNKTPYVVIYRKGTQVIAENNQKHRVKRNVSLRNVRNEGLEQGESEMENEIVENDNELEYEENNENGHTNESNPEQRVNRWPKRTHRPPMRFGHSVPSNFIP